MGKDEREDGVVELVKEYKTPFDVAVKCEVCVCNAEAAVLQMHLRISLFQGVGLQVCYGFVMV